MFTREGYSFAGWATNDNGSVVYSDGQFVSNLTTTASAVVRLYATWMPNAYKVAFDENGGTGEMGDEDFVFDEEKALASNAFNRDGYTFAGWATSSNGTAVYSDGQVVSNLTTTASAVVDLYATWTPKVYAVTLNANGGTVAPESVDVTFDDDWPALPTPMRDGYLFGGWHNDAECQSATPTDSQVAMTSDATIYAKWTPIAYTVAFDANGGTGKMVDEDFVYDEEKALTSNLFNCDGYTFAGWATNSNGTAVYIDGQVVSNLTTTAGDTLTLYATWSELRYIAFNGNGADDDAMADDVMSFVGVETKTLVANKFEKIGYTFAGWATNDTTAAELAVAYTNCEAVVSTNLWMAAGETNVLYAVWIDQSGTEHCDCMIVFYPNGGTGSMPNMVFDHAVGKTNLIACAFENGGHEFLGWARTSDGPVEFDDKDEVSLQYAEVLRLYAKWKPIAVSSPSAREDLVYNGTGQIGVADGDGYVIVGSIATNAGSYTATATLEEGYVWSDGTTGAQTVTWSIARATYDMSEITFSDKTFVADGTPKSIFIAGTLPEGVEESYDGNGKSDPGTYMVTAKFTGDTGNYNSISNMTATLTIEEKSDPAPPDPGPGPEPDPEPEETPVLHPNGVAALGAFTAEKAVTYNGWLKDDDERIVALLTVKTTAAKSGKQTKSTITVTPVNGKKYTKKTSFYPGGNPTDEFGIVYGARGLLGTFGGYSVEAGVDVYKSKISEVKALAAKIPVATHTFSVDTGNGMAVFSAVIAKTGKTKVQGYLEDGAKISISVTGALGENYFAVPVVSPKAATRCGFVLWFPLDGGSPTFANFYDSNWTASLSGGSYALSDGEHVFDFDEPDYRDYLASVDGFDVAPVGAVFTVKRSKWDAGKTVGRLKVVNGVPTVTGTSSPSNLSALKLTYTAKSGLVKGSFKLYYMNGTKLKNDTVTVTGVVVDGKLFGSGTIKKLGSFAVVAE